MGCGSSTGMNVTSTMPGVVIRQLSSIDDLTLTDIDSAWLVANRDTLKKPKNPPVIKRTGWKTIRIFVSSTFKDFDSEREILVKKVFPDLRLWCQSRRLHLIECDLRWGVPIDANTETTLRTCLGEIDRCYSENIMPFFVNMISERVGWIPLGEEIPEGIKSEYKWVEGLSVTEMEIMHGAYRIDNPNALFLLRDPSYLEGVPENFRANFIDENANIAPYKLQTLKSMISTKFKTSSRLIYYNCQFDGLNAFGKPRLRPDKLFAETVTKFFQDRIAAQYPLVEAKNLDPFEETKQQHEAFMKMTAERVVGRENLLDDLINSYVAAENAPPTLIFGGSGLGKTSILSALADRCISMASSNRLLKPTRSSHWLVFYHFVGAVPGSTDLLAMLRRLLLALKVVSKSSKLPSGLEEAMGLVRSALSKASTRNAIIIIDAVNQFDDYHGAPAPVSWLPTQLAPTIRLVVSATPQSKQYKLIHDLAEDWKLEQIRPLDRVTKRSMVQSQLARWNKQLDQGQLELLLNKQSSDIPLWLSLACEELRVFGQFREVTNKIRKMPDGLLELEESIFVRLELESEGSLLVATLCFLECSVRGLLESELLELLAKTPGLPDQLVNLLEEKDAMAVRQQSTAEVGRKKENKEKEATKKPVKRVKSKLVRISTASKTRKSSSTAPLKIEIPPVLEEAVEEEPTPAPMVEDGQERLTAKQWADLYRVLRPFVRPFGSSGEGRLDFYHRSVSKAVRRRYFSSVTRTALAGESVVKQDSIVACFHRVLADYFSERCPDLERRIEEYPKHAYLANDLEGLLRFLSDWQVFDAMYDEEFSRQLSQSWAYVYDLSLTGSGRRAARRLATGDTSSSSGITIGSEVYLKMEEVYSHAVDTMAEPCDVNTPEGAAQIERIEKVARVLMQNGRYDAAIRLANRLIGLSTPASLNVLVVPTVEPEQAEEGWEGAAKPIEEKDLTEADANKKDILRHAGFIYLKAQIFDEEMRSQDYMYQSHLPKLTILVDCFEKAISIFDRLAPCDERLGKCLNRVGFHYSGIAMRNGTEKLKKEDAKAMAIRRVEDAIDFYTRMSDQPVNLADCYITRGVCEGMATQQQIDYYMKGLNLAIDHVGLFHPILDRAYLNVGIYYEDNKRTQDAYAYFRKWYQLLVAVYGSSHPRTLRAIRILNEGVYQRLAAANGHSVPTVGLQLHDDAEEEDIDANTGPAAQLAIDEEF